MKINSYKLKDEFVERNIITDNNYKFSKGGTWINKNSEFCISKYLKYGSMEINIDIGFPKELKNWNDFDYVLVIDEDFLQPYTPFYGENYKKEINDFPALEYVIKEYNEFMDSLDFLERV